MTKEKQIEALAESICDDGEISAYISAFDGDISELDAARLIAGEIVKLLDEPAEKPDEIWICTACGEAENSDAYCELRVFAGEPINCPISSDEAEWNYVEKKPDEKPADKPCLHFFTIGSDYCSKCGERLIPQSRTPRGELEDTKEKFEAIKKDFLEDAEKCLVNLRKNNALINGGPHCQWIEAACLCLDALITDIAELKKEKGEDLTIFLKSGKRKADCKESDEKITKKKVYESKNLSDSEKAGYFYVQTLKLTAALEAANAEKASWRRVCEKLEGENKQLTARAEAEEAANRFGGEMLTKLQSRIKKLESRLKGKGKL